MIPDAFETAADLAPAAQLAAANPARAERWRPGLGGVAQAEIFASSREASGAGAALALALDAWRSRPRSEGEEVEDRRAVVWVQTRAAVKSGGRPFRPGLPPEIRHRLIHVLAEKDEDALFALEEAVRCRDVAFVIGELAGAARALDFTASRRLTLAAERHDVPLTLVRLDAPRELSPARQRWAVSATPSAHPQWNEAAPGTPASAGRAVSRALSPARHLAAERGCGAAGGKQDCGTVRSVLRSRGESSNRSGHRPKIHPTSQFRSC